MIKSNKTPSSFQTSLTRPQTAISRPQIQISMPSEEGLDTSLKQLRFTNPTSLSPRSLKRLQERKRMVAPRSVDASSHLRVTKDQAEIEAPENYFVKEIQINKDDYEKFRKNFHRIVFDAFGNYLYTKPDPQNEQQKEQVSSALSTKTRQTSQNLKRKLMLKTQSFQPRKIVDNLVKNAQEIAQMNPRRKQILDVKQRAEATLTLMIANMAKEKVLLESKSHLQSVTLEMLNEVDKFIRENQEQHDQLEMSKNQILELQSANESLNFKNQQLQKELKSAKQALDDIKRGSVDLERFIPQYRIISKKFPEFSAEKFVDRYEYFENCSLELTKKVSDLEEDRRGLEKQINTIRKEYESKLQEVQMQKQYTNQHQSQNNDLINKDLEQYRDMYMNLFKKIMQLYCDWTTSAKAALDPDKLDSGPRAGFVDPIQMLNNMETIIKISSTDRLQTFLRKIIVSANMLQRNYLKEDINLSFDPDRIYEKISKKLDIQKHQIEKLTEKNQQLLNKLTPQQLKTDDEPLGSKSNLLDIK